MRKTLLTLVILSIVLTPVCALAVNVSAYLSASEELQGMIANGSQGPAMPRVSSADVARIFKVISDQQRFLDSVQYQLADMGALMQVCEKANANTMAYALFDLKNQMDPKGDPNQIAKQVTELMERNMLRYQEELALLQPFQFRCMATQVPMLEKFIQSLPPEQFTPMRRAGLQKFRFGMTNIYYGALQMAGEPKISDAYRRRIFASLARNAETFASALPLASRRQVADLARKVRASSSAQMGPDLDTIIGAMSDTRCEGLCAL